VLEHVEANRTRHLIERGVPLEEIEGDFNVAVSARSQTGHNSGDESHGVDPCTGYVDDNGYVIDASDVAKILAAQCRSFLPERTFERSSNRPCDARSNHVAALLFHPPRMIAGRGEPRSPARQAGSTGSEPLTVGSTLFVDLPEDDISGDFTVTAIRPCPTPNPGDGYLVTTKFIYENAEILDLRIEGSNKLIGTTASHPFWSEDRQQFVAAGDLRIGENLLLADDTTRKLESLTRRENRETVYNIEVDGEHVFYVGEDGVLVHNSCRRCSSGTDDGPGHWRRFKTGLALARKGLAFRLDLELEEEP
jgi:hypothetical protein